MFGFGEKKIIGIDIGTSSIKMVELKMIGNRPTLTNYAWMSLDSLPNEKESKSSYFEVILPEYIKRILKQSQIDSREASFAISASGGLITLIEFPQIESHELDEAIRFEARKYIPMPLEDVVLSWDVTRKDEEKKRLIKKSEAVHEHDESENKKPAGKMEILLVAASKDRIGKYEQLAKEASLKIKSIEIESFSLVRSLIGNDQGNFVIVDIGAKICNIILVEKGIIRVNRNMDAGGRDVTKIIARSMEIDDERAEKVKIAENNFLSGESNIKFPVLDLIIGEVSRVISTYYKDREESALDGIILSGGTSRMSGLVEYFSQSLNKKTILGNSFGRISYDKKLEKKTKELNGTFAVAIGAALGGIEIYFKK